MVHEIYTDVDKIYNRPREVYHYSVHLPNVVNWHNCSGPPLKTTTEYQLLTLESFGVTVPVCLSFPTLTLSMLQVGWRSDTTTIPRSTEYNLSSFPPTTSPRTIFTESLPFLWLQDQHTPIVFSESRIKGWTEPTTCTGVCHFSFFARTTPLQGKRGGSRVSLLRVLTPYRTKTGLKVCK